VPATFPYLLMFMLWVIVACLVWLAAGLMFLLRRTRVFARRLCFAVAGTFPFVFAYQLIAAPFIAALFLAAFAIARILEPGAPATIQNPIVIAVGVSVVFLSFGTMLVASLAGFYEGWRIGWECANGCRFQKVLFEGPTVKLLGRFLQKARSILPP
jgi:hypothetical protein